MPALTRKRGRPGLLALGLAAAATAAALVLVVASTRREPLASRSTATEAEAPAPRSGILLRGPGAYPNVPPAPSTAPSTSLTAPEEAWAVHGRVYVQTTKEGVPGATVHAVLFLGSSTERLGTTTTTTAANGTYDLPLTALADLPALALRAGELEVWASAPGHVLERAHERRRLSRLRDPTHWTMDFGVRPARVLTGRVLDAEGLPVAFTTVRASSPGGSRDARGRTDAEGRYQLPIDAFFPPRGRGTGDVRVSVRATGKGVGHVDVRKTRASEALSLTAPDVLLEGKGSLGGIAVFPDGQPACGVSIEARLASGAAPSDDPGLRSGDAWTDREGQFVIKGLRPGLYWIAPRIPGDRHCVSCPTPETNLRLLVHHRRVRVLVRDANGRPLPGADVAIHRVRPDGYESRSAGPVGKPEASVSWWEPAGARLGLTAALPGPVVAERTITVRSDVWSEDVVLVLQETPRPWGHFRPQVTPQGGDHVERFVVSVATPLTGFRVRGPFPYVPSANKPIGPLPTGRWRLKFSTRATGLEERGFWLPGWMEASIVPGGVTDVVFRPRTGGRVRATVRAGARRDADDTPSLQLTQDGTDHTTMIYARWDEPTLSDVLEPGRWMLTSETDGFAPIEEKVVVVPDRIVEIDVTLREK